jgi:hypothetical protein
VRRNQCTVYSCVHNINAFAVPPHIVRPKCTSGRVLPLFRVYFNRAFVLEKKREGGGRGRFGVRTRFWEFEY